MINQTLIKNAINIFKYDLFLDQSNYNQKFQYAEFEKDNLLMDKFLSEIENISNRDYESSYFDGLLSRINCVPVIKKNDNPISLNYYIQMPFELHFIDYIWSLLVINSKNIKSKQSFLYGNIINSKLYSKQLNKKVIKNMSLITKYTYGYNKWLEEITNKYNENIESTDMTFLSIDFKRFYYHVCNPISSFISIYEGLIDEDLLLMSQLIDKIHLTYLNSFNKISSIRKTETETFLPIGLMSSKILSNLLLSDFDNYIKKMSNNIFYGRYVDDTMMLFKGKIDENIFKDQIVNYLNNHKILNRIQLNDSKLKRKYLKMNSNYFSFEYIIKNTRPSYYTEENDLSSAIQSYFLTEKKFLNSSLISDPLTYDQLLMIDITKLMLIVFYILDGTELKLDFLEKVKIKIYDSLSITVKPFIYGLYIKYMIKYFPIEVDYLIKSLIDTVNNISKHDVLEIKIPSNEVISTLQKNFYYKLKV